MTHTLAYKLMKRIITRGLDDGTLNREDCRNKLDAYLAADRITPDEYEELMALLEDANE